jgi:hypothetical protein
MGPRIVELCIIELLFGNQLRRFCDVDFVGDQNDHKTRIFYMLIFGNGVVAWYKKKQAHRVKAHYINPFLGTFGFSIIIHTIQLFQKYGTFDSRGMNLGFWAL